MQDVVQSGIQTRLSKDRSGGSQPAGHQLALLTRHKVLRGKKVFFSFLPSFPRVATISGYLRVSQPHDPQVTMGQQARFYSKAALTSAHTVENMNPRDTLGAEESPKCCR